MKFKGNGAVKKSKVRLFNPNPLFMEKLSRLFRGLVTMLCLLTVHGWVHAQNHSHVHADQSQKSSQSSPYGAMSASQCKEPDLKCAKSATPYFAPDGVLWLVWSAGGAISIARSTDLGVHFGPRLEIARHGAFLDTGPDARPQLVGDRAGNMTIAYAFFRDQKWNAQTNVSTSRDQGQSFSKPVSISNDPSSQRFATLSVDQQGQIFAVWIDKRLAAAAAQSGKTQPVGSIAYAWSSDAGLTFAHEHIARTDSCECCRIGVSMTPQGLPAIIYRAVFDGKIRDHATQVFISAEQTGPVERVAVDNWSTDSCPHHGPAIAVSAKGTLHTAWFTQGSARSGTFYARSSDQGRQYSTPRALGNAQAQPGRPYLLARGQEVWLVWKEFDGKRAAVFMQYSGDDGINWTQPSMVAESVGYSDHPLLLQNEHAVFLSWMTTAQGYRLIELSQ